MAANFKSRLVSKTDAGADDQVFDFITLKGNIRPLGMSLEDKTRVAVDGHAFRRVGLRAKPSELVAIRDFVDGDESHQMWDDLTALRGKLIDVYDDFYVRYADCLLDDVIKELERPALSHVGGVSEANTGAAVVMVNFRLILLHTHLPD